MLSGNCAKTINKYINRKGVVIKMNKNDLLNQWIAEERVAHIHGWDFSHIHGRYEEEHDLPWDYKSIILSYLRSDMRVLDIDTGGGEFLLTLKHPYQLLAATENYEPNVKLCEKTLLPLGIDFRKANGADESFPFEDHLFDIIINRHGSFNVNEIKRMLKTGGLFISEQVGAKNDRELAELLFNTVPELPFPQQYLYIVKKQFEEAGFEILRGEEAYRPIKFWDVGALVWFAHVIEWEFPGFSVENCLDGLYKAQDILENEGVIEGLIHRFLIVARV